MSLGKAHAFVVTLAILLLVAVGRSDADVLTFDDITTDTGCCTDIPDNYGGLTWSDSFAVLNPTANYTTPSGYLNGLVSGDYVALNWRSRDAHRPPVSLDTGPRDAPVSARADAGSERCVP